MDEINEVLSVRHCSKRFGPNEVLREVDFNLPVGVIYGICGSNGTGKSVFLRILSGLLIPDEGEIVIFGKRIGKDVEFAPSTGILIDTPGLLANLSGRKNLELLAMVSGNVPAKRIDEVIRQVGLNPQDKRPVSTYSTGMRQRLGLAQALMENPDLLLLDEPSSGLDFSGQKDIYTILTDLRNQGKTILITSHSLEELKILCDQVFSVDQGKFVPFLFPEMLENGLEE